MSLHVFVKDETRLAYQFSQEEERHLFLVKHNALQAKLEEERRKGISARRHTADTSHWTRTGVMAS